MSIATKSSRDKPANLSGVIATFTFRNLALVLEHVQARTVDAGGLLEIKVRRHPTPPAPSQAIHPPRVGAQPVCVVL